VKTKRLVCIGKVARAHGVKGEIKVFPYSQEADGLCSYGSLYFAVGKLEEEPNDREENAAGWKKVQRCRVQGKYAIVLLRGIASRAEADGLLGLEVHVNSDVLPTLDEEEFYWYEMEGMTVVSEEGEILGTVASLFSAGAHDILVVKGRDGEVMIPAIGEFIKQIDPQKKRLTVHLVPGLLDINR
jgi:16S rRNA processing protein RimM